MNIYHYDDQGYYLGSGVAINDPIGNQPMIPAKATATAPPSGSLESWERYLFLNGLWSKVDVQQDIDSLLYESNAKGTLLYADVGGYPVARSAQDISTDDVEADKAVLRASAFTSLRSDVYAELSNVFGTSDPNTATADYNTYKSMSASPALFSSEGLLAESDTTTYAVGDALDTDVKIQGYADEMLTKIDTYAVYRMNRKKQYKDAIIAIG